MTISHELNADTAQANRIADRHSDLHRHIQQEFATGGVEIMTPCTSRPATAIHNRRDQFLRIVQERENDIHRRLAGLAGRYTRCCPTSESASARKSSVMPNRPRENPH